MTEEQARKLCEQAKAPLPTGMHEGQFEKVSNTKRKVVDGISFRSTLEANVYQLLKSWELAGEIRDLKCQPKFVLQPKTKPRMGNAMRAITYTPDFIFQKKPVPPSLFWENIAIDAKGFRMEAYRIKAKLFRARFNHIELQEWTKETLKRNGG